MAKQKTDLNNPPTDAPTKFEFTAADISRILLVSQPAVEKWRLKARIIKKSFYYDIRDAARGRIESLQKKIENSGQGLTAARAKEIQARTEKVKMQTALMRAELLPAAIVEAVWSDQLSYFAAAMATIDARASRVICEKFGITDQAGIEKVIREFADEALHRISSYDVGEYLRRMGQVSQGEESDESEEEGGTG